jgi:hypothetical protein
LDNSAILRLWQHPSGIYKVFYLLVDGVTCTLIHSKDEVQKATCQVVMATLSLLLDVKGKRRPVPRVHEANLKHFYLIRRIRICSGVSALLHPSGALQLAEPVANFRRSGRSRIGQLQARLRVAVRDRYATHVSISDSGTFE